MPSACGLAARVGPVNPVGAGALLSGVEQEIK
jgi:hypothetical protein